MTNTSQTKLQNIELLRPFIVLLIVVNHCFAVYSGVWVSPWEEMPDVPVYKWLQRVSICCTLQLFTFISGYIFAYQSAHGKNTDFWQLVKKKLQRLILPCALFGVIYYCIKIPFAQMSFASFCQNMNNGMGHLWFLPMLFWCFVFTFILDRLNKNIELSPWLILSGLFAVSIVSPLCPNIIGFGNALRYWVYFYFGQLCMQNKILTKITRGGQIIILGIIYALLLGIYYYYVDNRAIIDSNKLFFIPYKLLDFLTRICGIMFFMAMATYIANKLQSVPKWIKDISALSFGVYIFHQIIIDVIYYKTSLPYLLGEIWLPWFALLVTTLLSFMLTFFLKKTRIGNFLIG